MAERINEIMDMLNWNNDELTQKKGIALAEKIDDLSIFIQPEGFENKAVWENCAKILYGKSDEQLEPYLSGLLEWLQDINWSGAATVMKRLKSYQGKGLELCLEQIVNQAEISDSENDLMWLDYLSELLDNKALACKLSENTLAVLKKHYHNWGYWYEE